MGTRTRWGRIDPNVQLQVNLMPSLNKVIKLNRKTLSRRVQRQLLLMASPSPFLNFMNKFRLDEILINHHYKGVYSMRTSATITELATCTWNVMSVLDRQPYIMLARKAQYIQQARKLPILVNHGAKNSWKTISSKSAVGI
ncbi:uncharacterized protein Dwil_GK27532 [Drosophila willistoni]|uniref:Uncharacterized protein n=1 Tax=Drosophila willistoni TaxID=7260 RepID=A0A0Q9X2Y6_DROWI|nr:uncharacterized protein LOC26529534 [Drosophila willistoni]KRG00250.1 uncharacterized protein Dwil_GK27532 [Drosophila willistoni]